MGKLKKIMLGLAAVTMTVSAAAAAACNNSDKYPDFINPTNDITKPLPGEQFNGEYTISVKSEGGLSLNGVTVSAILGGEVVAQGISINGQIVFDLDPAEYTLEVDTSTLPAGYFIPDGKVYKTSADNGNVTINISSAIIPTTAVSGTTYSLGDIMYDFSFRDSTTGVNHSLTELFNGKNAVMLNFFYTTCGPCQSEFPAIEEAYEKFSDKIEIIALADSGHDSSQEAVAKFRKEYGLNFYMGIDLTGMHSLFNVNSWPTTVIIDRFGAIAYWDYSGAITSTSVWSAIFLNYTSDDYSQKDHDEDDPDAPLEWTKPDGSVVMPTSEEISDAISNGEKKITNYRLGETEDSQESSWPWCIDSDSDGSYIYSSNAGTNYSFSTLYVDLNLESGDIVSFDYKLNTEADCDILYVLLVDLQSSANNSSLGEYSGDSDGWHTESALYIANRPISITIAFTYIKDQLQGPVSDDDFVGIKNLKIIKASDITDATDAATAAVSGNVVNGKYEAYKTPVYNEEDGYYYVTNDLGEKALLLADLLDTTSWSSLHFGSSSFTTSQNSQAKASLYLMSFWQMSNHETASQDRDGLVFDYDTTADKHISETLISNYYWQSFSDNGYVPVTKELKEVLDAFAKYYCNQNNKSYYEEQWLEFCYYFNHYGADHKEGENCYVYSDPTLGLAKHNSLTAYEGTSQNPVANHVNVTKLITADAGGGLFYKFVPSHTGVYYLYTTKNSESVDPLIMVRTENDNSDDRFIAEFDNDMSPDKFLRDDYDNVKGYVYLEQGVTYYLQCRFYQIQSTGEYDFFIEYTGSTGIDYLRFCTTGDGLWTYNDKITYYIAISVALGSDNKYYALNNDGSFGSNVYIDFIHPQYYDQNNHSLLDIINEGHFNFTDKGGADLTAAMLQFYQQSIAGKDEDDELYGMVEASYTLVYIINEYLRLTDPFNEGLTTGQWLSTGFWLAFATYYEHIGV